MMKGLMYMGAIEWASVFVIVISCLSVFLCGLSILNYRRSVENYGHSRTVLDRSKTILDEAYTSRVRGNILDLTSSFPLGTAGHIKEEVVRATYRTLLASSVRNDIPFQLTSETYQALHTEAEKIIASALVPQKLSEKYQ